MVTPWVCLTTWTMPALLFLLVPCYRGGIAHTQARDSSAFLVLLKQAARTTSLCLNHLAFGDWRNEPDAEHENPNEATGFYRRSSCMWKLFARDFILKHLFRSYPQFAICHLFPFWYGICIGCTGFFLVLNWLLSHVHFLGFIWILRRLWNLV